MVTDDGGRYDVDVQGRVRQPVYWDECDSHVRRCSWFFRSDTDSRMVPYEEEFAARLEVRHWMLFVTWLETDPYRTEDGPMCRICVQKLQLFLISGKSTNFCEIFMKGKSWNRKQLDFGRDLEPAAEEKHW